jgi:hypothetical protein
MNWDIAIYFRAYCIAFPTLKYIRYSIMTVIILLRVHELFSVPINYILFHTSVIYHVVHANGVRLRLWTAATNGSIAHPQVICEHREPWRNDIGRESSWFVHQSSLEILSAKSSSSKAGDMDELNNEFSLTKNLCSYFEEKLYDMGPKALLPLQKKACCGFCSP